MVNENLIEGRRKRVAIVGAGSSGLTAIKCLLEDERSFEPVCFEKTDFIGGLWHYTEKPIDGVSSVMKSTVINISKEMMCFSDFPMPKEYPIFMHNSRLLEYIHDYTNHFNLLPYVRLSTEVVKIEQKRVEEEKEKGEEVWGGEWVVKTCDQRTREEREEVFDFVLVCNGHLADKLVPHFAGEKDFRGRMMHTHDYRDHRGFEDQRVVVVGLGNSAGDAAVELSRIGCQVFLSTRRGAWIVNRIWDQGDPYDMILTRRCVKFLQRCIPLTWWNWYMERKLNRRFDHSRYGLKPDHRYVSQQVTVNDELANRLACGAIEIRPNVRRILERGIEFEDGSVEENIDTIILATGYNYHFPFLDKEILDVSNNEIPLYKYVFPPDLRPPTLAVVGCLQPTGGFFPTSEMQCRWAIQVFKGEDKLPSIREMWSDVHGRRDRLRKVFYESKRYTITTDWLLYMDDLARRVGCMPDLRKLLLLDPLLGLKVFFGPCTPYQYRLHGRGKWEGAREAIMTQWDRTFYPLTSHPIRSTNQIAAPSTDSITKTIGLKPSILIGQSTASRQQSYVGLVAFITVIFVAMLFGQLL